MRSALQKIPEYSAVSAAFLEEEIVPQAKPAVFRKALDSWPAVRAGRQSPQSMCDYLKRFDAKKEMTAAVGPSSRNGRFFYRDETFSSLNFEPKRLLFGNFAEELLQLQKREIEKSPGIAVQSALIKEYFPGFDEENNLPFFTDQGLSPRIWMGNSIIVSTHFDDADNLCCVVSGRRHFTLFPPEQIFNLYAGPLEKTPGGIPTASLVDIKNPDFSKYPRFEKALAAGQVAELEPGDILFIPALWWHQVESLDPLNILVNYWWRGSVAKRTATGEQNDPFTCLIHALITIRDLPPAHRNAWRSMFDYFVFRTGTDPAEHIPPKSRGILGSHSPQYIKAVKNMLAQILRNERNKI
jgi:hypothetical protein